MCSNDHVYILCAFYQHCDTITVVTGLVYICSIHAIYRKIISSAVIYIRLYLGYRVRVGQDHVRDIFAQSALLDV